MDAAVAEELRNFGQIVHVFADVGFGAVDFELVQIFHDAAADPFFEHDAHLGPPDGEVVAQHIQRQVIADMLVHVADHFVGHAAFLLAAGDGGRFDVPLFEACADQVDQQRFQMQLEQLLASERGVVPRIQDSAAARGAWPEGVPAFLDQPGEHRTYFVVQMEQLMLEKERHGLGFAFEGDDEDVRGHFSVAFRTVEFVGLVEQQVALLQVEMAGIGVDFDLALVHVKDFPKVVLFAGVPVVFG